MPITRYDDPVKLRYNMMLLLSWLYHAKSAIYLPSGYERVGALSVTFKVADAPFHIHMLSRYAMMLLPRYIQCMVIQLLREMGDGMTVCIL